MLVCKVLLQMVRPAFGCGVANVLCILQGVCFGSFANVLCILQGVSLPIFCVWPFYFFTSCGIFSITKIISLLKHTLISIFHLFV